MIVEKIYKYLGGDDQDVRETILEESQNQFHWIMKRQFMRESHPSTGKLYPSSLGKKCARQLAFKYYGFPPDSEMPPRSTINFWMGDLSELAMLSLAKLAGLDVNMDFERLNMEITYQDDLVYRCHGYIDGLLHTEDEDMVIECKSKTKWGFKRFEKEGPSNSWGYLTQMHLYLKNLGLDRGIFLVLNKETGHIAEHVVKYDEKYVEKARDNIRQVLNSGPDNLPAPFQSLEEFYWMKNNKVYDLGKNKDGDNLPFCNYCSYVEVCWGENLTKKILKSGPKYRYKPEEPKS